MAQESWKREQGSGAGCQQQSDRNILCTNNCGFFGSASTSNMCSKCYAEHVSKTMQAAACPPSPSRTTGSTSSQKSDSLVSTDSTSDGVSRSPPSRAVSSALEISDPMGGGNSRRGESECAVTTSIEATARPSSRVAA